MLKKIIVLAFLAIFLSIPVYSFDGSLEAKIEALNTESIRALGISLRELGYLAQVTGGTYMPLWAAERSGEIKLMRSLEEAGYLRVEIVQGLPDGTREEITFVNAAPSPSGRKVCNSLRPEN